MISIKNSLKIELKQSENVEPELGINCYLLSVIGLSLAYALLVVISLRGIGCNDYE
jgi:hypothetical protein